MPMDPERYPADWPAISLAIKERAGWRCERCGVEHHARGWRDAAGEFHLVTPRPPADSGWLDERGQFHRHKDHRTKRAGWRRVITIVLTTAHLGITKPNGEPGDPHDKLDCRPDNLAALCQKCHLNYDQAEHGRTRARTRRAALKERGQQELFTEHEMTDIPLTTPAATPSRRYLEDHWLPVLTAQTAAVLQELRDIAGDDADAEAAA